MVQGWVKVHFLHVDVQYRMTFNAVFSSSSFCWEKYSKAECKRYIRLSGFCVLSLTFLLGCTFCWNFLKQYPVVELLQPQISSLYT